MPLADDVSAPTPTKIAPPPKRRTTKKTTPIIGPVAPQIAAQQSPTRVSKAPKVQAPVPTYTKQVQNTRVVDTKKIASKSSNDVSDFISGLRDSSKDDVQSVLAGADHYVTEDSAFDRLMSFRQADVAAGDGSELLGRREELQQFLKKIRPEGYDPEYGGVAMPEAWKHRGNNVKNPLKPHWDAKEIAENLADFEPGSSFARFAMNDILEKQLRNQSNWVKRQTVNRAYRLQDTLKEASDAAFDGDFDYLAEKLEKNPDLLEFAKYKDDYTVGPDEIWDKWVAERDQYNGDEYVKGAMRARTDDLKSHYEYVRKYYTDARKIANRAIQKYEKSYNRSVEFAENKGGKKAVLAKAAGPAIPEPKNSDKSLVDRIANETPEFKGSARFESDREQAKQRLGVDKLPSVRDMLASLVAQGQIDPDNEGEIAAWISRLQNPNHPDTRAMYVAFARSKNKALDLEGDALEYINEPINSFINKENTKAQRAAELKAKQQEKSQEVAANAVPDILETVLNPGNWNKDDFSEGVAEDLVQSGLEVEGDEQNKGITKAASGLFWTFDKLARASYAVAGATDEWNRLDQDDPKGSKPWWQPGAGGVLGTIALAPVNILQGKNLQDSIDDVWKDPKSLAKPAGEAYQQFFRGSDLPGIKEDTVPITFSQVIANNALWDPEDNIYDKSWYQHTAGFALDVGMDPLNFVGVGAVSTVLKTPAELMIAASKGGRISEDAVQVSRLVRELNNPALSPKAEKAWRVQQVLARQGDEYHGDALLTEAGASKMNFTVEHVNDSTPVGNSSQAPTYTNARFYDDTKATSAALTAQINELKAQRKSYPGLVALESYKQDLQKIVDELDLGGMVEIPELRIRTLMEQNATPIRIEGVDNLSLNNPGGRFWRDVLSESKMQDAVFNWPGHRSTTKFAEFTDETGKTRLTEKAAAARRALDEEEEFYRTGSIAPEDVTARWNKALDEAGDTDPTTGKPHMWQEYDVEHFLDEGAPGLFTPQAEWTPLKAYAKGSGLSPEDFSRITGWTNEDIIRSLHRGPKMLAKQDPTYARKLEEAQTRVRYSKQKIASAKNPAVKANAYRALQMAYRDMSQATLEGSFRYLDGLRGKSSWIHGQPGPETTKANQIDEALAALDEIDTADDAVRSFDDSGNVGYDGSYREIDLDDFDSVEDALNSVDSAEFPSKQAQVEALRSELEEQRKTLNVGKYREDVELKTLSDAEAIELDNLLPVESPFRKGDGFDHEEISKYLTHNREDISKGTTGVFKVSYKRPPLRGEGEVAKARQAAEMRFLDVIAKRIEEKADELYRIDKTKIVAEKTSKKPVSEGLQNAQDELSQFWTKGKDGREGPTVRKLGPRPTYKSVSDELEVQYPNTFAKEKGARAEELNKKRNPEAEIDVEQATGYHQNVKWDFARGSGKTAASRRIEAVVKSKQRQWDKAIKTAQETDAARYAELRKEISDLKQSDVDFQLTPSEIQTLYKRTYLEAKNDVLDLADKHKSFMSRGANSRLTLGETTTALQKKAADLIRWEEIKLKIAKAETDLPDELATIERKRKDLIKKKIALYDRVKKSKMEANTVRVTMMHRIGEDELMQAITMPERLDGRALQIHIMGMKKNLQFTSAMFKGAEYAEKFVPSTVWAKWQDTFYRPSKRVNSIESIEARAMWEGKTPVVIHSLQKRLTKAMANTTDTERSGMLMAYRKGIPYGGPKQLEYQRVVEQLDEIMDIINGKHIGYMFKQAGRSEAKALTPYELLRFLPEEYAPNLKVLMRSDKGAGEMHTVENAQPDPFAPIPQPNSNLTFDDLMNAIESNGKSTPKDLIDPFRVAWVYNLAAGQAASFKAFTKTVGESFGVLRPETAAKTRIWRRLETEHGWQSFEDIPNVLFPPEAFKEVKTLLEFTKPGPEQAAITKMMDQAIGYWKQGMTIYNPAYYTRNGVGEMMVSWLDGVNSPKWYAKSHRILKYVKKTDQDVMDLVNKYDVLEGKIPVDVAKGNEVLFSLKGGQKVRIEDAYKEYVDQGLMSTFANTDIGRGVRGLANQSLTSNSLRRGMARANNKVHEVGEGFEDYLRLAHFLHAMEKSGKGSIKEAARYAAQRVRRSHFDYTDFSDFEKTVMLRAFPFYKWIRRGAPLMVQHLFMTPGKMIAAPKAMDALSGLGLDPMNLFNEGPVLDTQDVYEDKNGYLPNYSGIAPAWIRDLFAYQMQPAEDDEYANFFRVSLPQFDGLQGLLSFGEGNFGDSTAYTLMNPMLKAPIELGRNERLDPDANFPIVGGEFNEQVGINDNEARGAYLAQQANPWTAFLAKLSKNGKLPDGLNISNGESNRDATRDVASFFSGMGLYQSKLGYDGETPVTPSAVGQFDSIAQVPHVSGVPAALTPNIKNSDNETALKKLIESNTNTFDGEDSDNSAKGWIDYKKKKSGWIPNKYGNRRGSYSGLDIMALLRSLREGVDQGRVIDLEAFDE